VGYVLTVLLMLLAIMMCACAGLSQDVGQYRAEILSIRQQLDRYFAHDTRLLDELWNRAKIETARATKVRRP
jgi:hypothetical protein